MPAPNPTEYMRNWRKLHPNYSRDNMRERRGGLHPPGRKLGRVNILGVFVDWRRPRNQGETR